MERRFLAVAQEPVTFEERSDEVRKFIGYAARYFNGNVDTEYTLWDYPDATGKMRRAVERIMPGAFDRALREGDDIRMLFNHDPSMLLARSSSGTLTLSSFDKGLRYIGIDPDTQVSRDVAKLVKRGDIRGSSFSFMIRAQDEKWDREGDTDIRNIVNFSRVFDVGPVTFPAYEGTTAGMRSGIAGANGWTYYIEERHIAEARASFEQWQRRVIDQRETVLRRSQYAQALECC